MKKILNLLFGLIILFSPLTIKARDVSQITDWYIKNFQSEIIVNKDSSLSITEKITADCGNLPDKHGIFRILPTFYQKSTTEKINTPVKLESITDFNGNSIPYSTSKNLLNKTITWKIGDPNKAVTGINNYQIKYTVQNAIRFDNTNFDELYWNLNGNFWNIETDHFIADIRFPAGEINKNNAREINLYSGSFSQNNNNLAKYSWTNDNALQIESLRTLKNGEGITLSVTFPKNIITPYKPPFLDKYGFYLFLLVPFLIFLICLNIWKKYGKDPRNLGPAMAKYDIPDNLSPIELSMLEKEGMLNTKAITAAIINLAVKSYLKIEELPQKGIFGQKDFRLTKQNSNKPISEVDKNLLEYLFEGSIEIQLSNLKNKFYTKIPKLRDQSFNYLNNNEYIIKSGLYWLIVMLVCGFLILGLGIFAAILFWQLGVNLIIASIIIITFGALMTKRTQKGAETYQKIKGFKLFITMTEKYRANFNEKENIFEKFLPYAMLFGLTGVWIKNMKAIYGEEYFNTYHPVWFYGAMYTNFDANTFNSMIDNLSSNMSSTIASNPSSSGAGGGGFAGGGGGGGGGGGW